MKKAEKKKKPKKIKGQGYVEEGCICPGPFCVVDRFGRVLRPTSLLPRLDWTGPWTSQNKKSTHTNHRQVESDGRIVGGSY